MDRTKIKTNLPSYQIAKKPLSLEELHAESCVLPKPDGRLNRINEEFRKGLSFIKKYPRSVTFYGSARIGQENPLYQKAYELAKKISFEGFSIITGGGPGIMEAANKGAYDAGGDSLGLNIDLPKEQRINPYVKDSVDFYYFFSRKVALSFSANAYIFFPGGFGTLDEFSEILELVQTKKIPEVPIILVDSSFWGPLDMFFRKTLFDKFKTINYEDLSLYKITDDEEEILEIVKNTPLKKISL